MVFYIAISQYHTILTHLPGSCSQVTCMLGTLGYTEVFMQMQIGRIFRIRRHWCV